ncbi:hypothetical protein [Nonomuraea phyllanthi]|uniref:hypothetical protein n=1 Tax=Nonomuraea phyllanthi TaxID=2219224 RepID=UPI001D139DE1|nr:hypothetical protein [Nonomuraea phyllanthi]
MTVPRRPGNLRDEAPPPSPLERGPSWPPPPAGPSWSPALRKPAVPSTTSGRSPGSLGWIFLWAFLDKTFGWGFATPAAKAWINGGSPTTGFLKGTGEHALGGFFGSLAGQAWVD